MTKIQWTDEAWNPIVGCSVVSPGCTNCYAMRLAARLARMGGKVGAKYRGLTKTVNGNPVWTGEFRLHEEALALPLRWRKPRRVFVNSMSDLFHESVPDEWIDRVFAIMALAPQHVFQVLTKRPERMRHYACRTFEQWHGNTEMFADRFNAAMDWNHAWINNIDDMPWPLPNVWLGTSVEDQARADERIPVLLDTSAAVRFLSCEPLLGPVDLSQWLPSLWPVEDVNRPRSEWKSKPIPLNESMGPPLNWVIVGGESGPGARPFDLDWARSIVAQCRTADVPCFVKQIGANPILHGFTGMPIKDRKGGDMAEWPEDLRVREMPDATP